MANTFVNPKTGNHEIWKEKPEGYLTPEEWAELHPTPEPEPPTMEELQVIFTEAIQGYLDDFAKTRNYDGILSASTYATSTIPKFKSEGQYAVEVRDSVWAKGYEILNDVMSKERPVPTLEEVLAELPVLSWPE